MLGSGGILLAAAIFASSINTGPVPAGAPAAPAAAPAGAPPVVMPVPAQRVTAPPPPAAEDDETGDTQFGAPMVSTKPMAESVAEPAPIVTDPDSAVGNGGRQYQAKNTPHHYPIPK